MKNLDVKKSSLLQGLEKPLRNQSLLAGLSHHDKFFKRFYTHPPFARELVQLILTKKELGFCDLSTLKVEKLKGRRMDLVLSLGLKQWTGSKIRVVVLFEHKSKYDKKMYRQVLEYQLDLYTDFESPVLIIPALFYNGKQPWKWKLSFQEAVLGDFFEKIPLSFRKSMLEYGLRFVDNREGTQRRARLEGFKTELVLRVLNESWKFKDRAKVLKAVVFDFLKVFKGERWVLPLVQYARSLGVPPELWAKVEAEAIKRKLLNKGGFMDIREDIRKEIREEAWLVGWKKGQHEGRQEGRQEGRHEGRQEGRQERDHEVVFNMFKKDLDISLISEVTGLPVQEIKKLKKGPN